MKTQEIKEKRAAKIAELKTISTKAETENRDLSGEERTRFDALTGEVEGLNRRLTDAERLAEFERLEGRADTVTGSVERRGLEGYSVAKALSESRSGVLTGMESEWHQELSRDRGEVRGVMIPTEVILGGESRVLKTTTPGAGPGSNLIATDLAAMTDRRRAALRIEGLGATVLRGLTGNLDLPRLTESGTAGWIAEHTDAPRSDPKFKKTRMDPKTVAAEYEVSRKMLLQSSAALEPILRADLAYLLSQRLDAAAIRGGGANEPTGILADSNVAELPGIAGAQLLSDLTADLIAALETDDVTGTRAFLTNPSLMAKARKVRDTDGHVITTAEQFHGERVETSTQVPGNIGAALDADALVYGEWASLYLGYWSGIDILVNPYHADVASKGGALIHAFLDCDVAVRHPEGFRWAAVS
ncbi:phage major capsid protein [uncultured Jannaschia sp.]|uniref:phage major capsid protein n=1 Tax=uncultured Jannaschia sp. TaxID=293347 RepID=UPI00260DB263|nr:phage major capsid protein [uncultured Jannaschia sp.]